MAQATPSSPYCLKKEAWPLLSTNRQPPWPSFRSPRPACPGPAAPPPPPPHPHADAHAGARRDVRQAVPHPAQGRERRRGAVVCPPPPLRCCAGTPVRGLPRVAAKRQRSAWFHDFGFRDPLHPLSAKPDHGFDASGLNNSQIISGVIFALFHLGRQNTPSFSVIPKMLCVDLFQPPDTASSNALCAPWHASGDGRILVPAVQTQAIFWGN